MGMLDDLLGKEAGGLAGLMKEGAGRANTLAPPRIGLRSSPLASPLSPLACPYAQYASPAGSVITTSFRNAIAFFRPSVPDIRLSSCSMLSTWS